MANDLEIPRSKDPATLSYPPTLPVELALREHPKTIVLQAYKIDEEEWDRIRVDPIFIRDLEARVIELQTEGVSFKMKARLQAEEYLKKLWRIAENKNDNDTPADHPVNVRADVMKFVIRAAGLDGSKDQAANAAVIGNALSITLHLG
jgi:hypothetical protein